MKKSNLASELREHRERHDLSAKQLADKFNVPEHDYTRIETGAVVPGPEEEKRYRNLLAQEKLGPPGERKWYQSKAWYWPVPIVICMGVLWLLSLTDRFRSGLGEYQGANPPIAGYTVASIIFCLCFWHFWRPEFPWKKNGALYSMFRIIIRRPE